jgi:hypothetical protein
LTHETSIPDDLAETLTGDTPPIIGQKSQLAEQVAGRDKPPEDAPEEKQLPAPAVAELVNPAREKPDEPFEPTGKSDIPWKLSGGARPQSTPWTVQPKDGAQPVPPAIQSIPMVRCPTCNSERVHKYGRSKLKDGRPGSLYYYQCQNCTDPRTGYALTRFRVLHT